MGGRAAGESRPSSPSRPSTTSSRRSATSPTPDRAPGGRQDSAVVKLSPTRSSPPRSRLRRSQAEADRRAWGRRSRRCSSPASGRSSPTSATRAPTSSATAARPSSPATTPRGRAGHRRHITVRRPTPRAGRLRCVLARAVGVANEVAVDVMQLELLPGDQFLSAPTGSRTTSRGRDRGALLGVSSVRRALRRPRLRARRARQHHGGRRPLRVRDPIDIDVAQLPAPLLRLSACPLPDPRPARVPPRPGRRRDGRGRARDDPAARGPADPALFVVLEGRVRLARTHPIGEVDPAAGSATRRS